MQDASSEIHLVSKQKNPQNPSNSHFRKLIKNKQFHSNVSIYIFRLQDSVSKWSITYSLEEAKLFQKFLHTTTISIYSQSCSTNLHTFSCTNTDI